MPHHFKSGGKKQRLTLTLVGEPRHFTATGFIKHMAN
ncbi:Uncharacterised protein [Shigella sonnei]|nr:Uncharacterised protein [Shigella sonnei]CSG44327.1 Uncharacterised protein [Shigella sonnei]